MASTTIQKYQNNGSFFAVLPKGLIESLPDFEKGTVCDVMFVEGKITLSPRKPIEEVHL